MLPMTTASTSTFYGAHMSCIRMQSAIRSITYRTTIVTVPKNWDYAIMFYVLKNVLMGQFLVNLISILCGSGNGNTLSIVDAGILG